MPKSLVLHVDGGVAETDVLSLFLVVVLVYLIVAIFLALRIPYIPASTLRILVLVFRVPDVSDVISLRAVRNRAFERLSQCFVPGPFFLSAELASFVGDFLELSHNVLNGPLVRETFVFELLESPFKLLDSLYQVGRVGSLLLVFAIPGLPSPFLVLGQGETKGFSGLLNPRRWSSVPGVGLLL